MVQNCSSRCKCVSTYDTIPCRCVCSINNIELTLQNVTTTPNCCGNNIKINYVVSCSYQDNNCLNTTICKECSLTYLVPNCCCNCNINPVVTFDGLNVDQLCRKEIVVRANCNIKY